MEELIILQKTYDMVLYGLGCLKQFPKSEKYGLAADIKKTMYGLLRLITAANKRYYKKTTMQEIDVELDILRTMIRIAADRKYNSGSGAPCLSINKYENWSKMLNECGRLLGGWLKSVKI